ncbi:hypothetical protein EI94DRAFT_1708826 [Lactarius quietus]|nr:hypothetical protein EI94DRAFT_1708826 [Lactarius quietus]
MRFINKNKRNLRHISTNPSCRTSPILHLERLGGALASGCLGDCCALTHFARARHRQFLRIVKVVKLTQRNAVLEKLSEALSHCLLTWGPALNAADKLNVNLFVRIRSPTLLPSSSPEPPGDRWRDAECEGGGREKAREKVRESESERQGWERGRGGGGERAIEGEGRRAGGREAGERARAREVEVDSERGREREGRRGTGRKEGGRAEGREREGQAGGRERGRGRKRERAGDLEGEAGRRERAGEAGERERAREGRRDGERGTEREGEGGRREGGRGRGGREGGRGRGGREGGRGRGGREGGRGRGGREGGRGRGGREGEVEAGGREREVEAGGKVREGEGERNCHDYPEAHTWESRAEEDIEEEEAVRALIAAEDDSYLAYDEACKVRQLVTGSDLSNKPGGCEGWNCPRPQGRWKKPLELGGRQLCPEDDQRRQIAIVWCKTSDL